VPRTRTEAHKLIEEAMLAANVCAADFIAGGKHPSLYRVHEGPTPEKRVRCRTTCGPGPRPAPQRRAHAAEMQAIAKATQDRPMRADPHDAAALDAAGHLHRAQQRPLRPGLRGLHALHQPDPALPRPAGAPRDQGLLGGKRYHLAPSEDTRAPEVRRGGKAVPQRAAPSPCRRRLALWEAVGAHCSANERRADEASRDVEAWLKCRYMREHLGEEFSGHGQRGHRASASSSRSTRCMSTAWCTSPNWAASTTASTRRARNCAASAPACAMASGRGCGCRSAGSTWTVGRSTSAWCARRWRPPAGRAARSVRNAGHGGRRTGGRARGRPQQQGHRPRPRRHRPSRGQGAQDRGC
jgi:hypothetical protein